MRYVALQGLHDWHVHDTTTNTRVDFLSCVDEVDASRHAGMLNRLYAGVIASRAQLAQTSAHVGSSFDDPAGGRNGEHLAE